MPIVSLGNLYLPMLVVPLWFIGYCGFRFIKHWNDGIERKGSYISTSQLIKIVMVLLMACINLYNSVEPLPETYSGLGLFIRTLYYLLSALGWFMSLCLLIFEFNRRMCMSLLGHRLFWVLSFVVNSVKVALQLCEVKGTENTRGEYVRFVLFVSSSLFSFCLCMFAIFKPNDFQIVQEADYIEPSPFRVSKLIGASNENLLGLYTPIVAVSIKDYKIKISNEKQLLKYIIIVKVDGKPHPVKRSYSEFESLHKYLKGKFTYKEYPSINLPAFPVFRSPGISLEHRMKVLCNYLEELCLPECMCQELLDFLEITGYEREVLYAEHKKVLEMHLNLYTPRMSYTEDETQANPDIFVVVKLTKHFKTEEDTFYTFNWKVQATLEEGAVSKSFYEMYLLYQDLKRNFHSASMPPYKFRLGSPATSKYQQEETNQKLEKFWSFFLNDPAFHCQELFEFFEIKSSLEEVWNGLHTSFEYKLYEPVCWESEIDEGGSNFIVYRMKVLKKTLSGEILWIVKRRYKEFYELHKRLKERYKNGVMEGYLKHIGELDFEVPHLPKKSLAALSSYYEIELRKKGLEAYLSKLIKANHVLQSFVMKDFLQEPGYILINNS